ncbi:MAG: SMP-30/gluconolactonase/LRE family protein [Anaerolineae bacterium]|nr:SMP-30/gluconolactonase/LRE family protein [Anaerolineae bacterium]
MVQRIQALPQWQRIIIFVLLVLAVIVGLFLLTLAVAWWGINGTPRITPVTMQDAFTVREFAALPGDEAYPAALALAADGTLYTGSYLTGDIWQISPAGTVTALPGTGAVIGSITGLALDAAGTLFVLDRLEPLTPAGAILWRIDPGAAPQQITRISADPARLPYDLALDAAGRLYVTYVIEGGADIIARYDAAGSESQWWTAPQNATITGLAYDAAGERLIVANTRQNILYGLPVAADDPAGAVTEVFVYGENRTPPGFDGLTVAPNGDIYVAALGLNRVARITPSTGELIYLAGAFRGSSRVAYDAARERLYVNNWEARSLLPERVLFVELDVYPHLPFTVDVVEPVPPAP